MPHEPDAKQILTASSLETTRTLSYYVDEEWKLSSKIYPWMKQSTWLRIFHSGDWCLRLALCTPSGACHKRRRSNNNRLNSVHGPLLQ